MQESRKKITNKKVYRFTGKRQANQLKERENRYKKQTASRVNSQPPHYCGYWQPAGTLKEGRTQNNVRRKIIDEKA